MNFHKLVAGASVVGAILAVPGVAQAQTATAEPYVGASVGHHDIGAGFPDDNGFIYGVVAGVDFPVGETFFVGAEGNFHLGDGIIDNEYGIAARAGVEVGRTAKLYVRGGYQEVDFDFSQILGAPLPAGVDTSDGDYLVGAGFEYSLGDGPVKLRGVVDTIAFDTTRVTGGVLFAF